MSAPLSETCFHLPPEAPNLNFSTNLTKFPLKKSIDRYHFLIYLKLFAQYARIKKGYKSKRRQMGKFTDSIKNKFDKMFPNYLKLGDEQLAKKNYKKAIEFYQQGLVIQGYNPFLHYNWAACLFALGRYEEACKKFKRATRIKKDFGDAYLYWGQALININQPHQAYSKFKYAAMFNKEDPRPYFHWGLLLEQLEKHDEAKEKYDRVLELTAKDEQNRFRHYRLMTLNQFAQKELGKLNFSGACTKFQEILNIDPDFGPALYNYAIAAARTGQLDTAARNLKKAIDQDLKLAKRAKIEPAFEKIFNHPELLSFNLGKK